MAATDYAAKRATAARLLEKFGAPAVIVSTEIVGGTPFDPGEEVETENAVTAAVVDYTEKERSDAPSIQVGDKKALITAGGVVPTTAMTFRWLGVSHQIMNVMTIAPAGLAVLYEIRVRR